MLAATNQAIGHMCRLHGQSGNEATTKRNKADDHVKLASLAGRLLSIASIIFASAAASICTWAIMHHQQLEANRKTRYPDNNKCDDAQRMDSTCWFALSIASKQVRLL